MTETLPLISIGIPVYNCNKYIEQCAVSLFSQSYKHIEYVFVDDCSTDNSLEILRNVVSRYPTASINVKIICNDRNRGLWYTRNRCIDNMCGEYFMFCDSDDWIEHYAVQTMYDKITESHADVCCSPLYVNSNDKETVVDYGNTTLCDLSTIPNDVLHFGLTTKLFSSRFFREMNLRVYKEINCWEDLCITVRIFALTQYVVLNETPFYHYRKDGQSSLTAERQQLILSQHINCAEKLTEWFAANDISTRYAHFLNYLQFTAKIKMLRVRNKDFKAWKECFPESNRYIMKYRNIPLKYRYLFQLVNLLPTTFTQSLYNIIKKNG